jgi:ribosomal protein S18 acetylase RimI-like enzyme
MTHQTEVLEAALPASITTRPARAWVAIRRLGLRHAPRVLAHLLALNERDRLLRFGQAATDDQIRGYVGRIDFGRDELFGIFGRRLQLLAMAHLALDPAADGPGTVVEFGVSVLERARGRGYGGRLFDHAVTHARNRGADTMILHISRDNPAMLGIVSRAGAELAVDGDEAVAQLPLPRTTLGSQIEELVGHRAAEIDYCFKMHALRLDRLRPGRPTGPANGD